MAGFFDNLPAAPRVRIQIPMGGLFDVPTGRYYYGKHGEALLNCGLGAVNAIAGPPNGYKSEITNYFLTTVLTRHLCSAGLIYDTENSMNYERIGRLLDIPPNEQTEDWFDPEHGRLRITPSASMLGDVYFEEIKKIANERYSKYSKIKRTTPFIDDHGNHITMLDPLVVVLDSLTEFKSTAVQDKLVDKNAVGESGANTQFMKDAAAKTQMITQLPNLCNRGGLFFVQVAHVGVKIEIDPYAPKPPKLAYAGRGRKTKGTPEKFDFINNNLFEIYDAGFLPNSSKDKSALYPKYESDRLDENKDLMWVEAVITRNKNGPSGVPLVLLFSQSDGMLPHLSMYHYLKESNDFGLTASGNKQSYTLHLYPDITLTRTTVRSLIDGNYALQRAIEITAQMRQMEMLWGAADTEHLVPPKELYETIKALGYDWSILLEHTRGYWVYEEEAPKQSKYYLSTLDLLRMAKNLYRPYWYDTLLKTLSKTNGT